MNYKKLRVFGKGRRRLLEDEDEDDWLGGGGLGNTTQYRDYPASMASSSHPFALHSRAASASALSQHNRMSAPSTPMREYHLPSPSPGVQPPSPYLMGGMRAASSGSIFHEAVWPPPSDANRFVDPLVEPSQSGELTGMIGDVMGPGADATQRVVTYGTPVVVSAASSGLHGRAPSQAGLLSYSHPDPSPSSGVQGSPLPPQTPPRRQASEPLLDVDADNQQGIGSPIMDPPQTRLFVKNGEAPQSPASPTQSERGFGQAQAQATAQMHQGSGSPSSSPRWLDRQLKKT